MFFLLAWLDDFTALCPTRQVKWYITVPHIYAFPIFDEWIKVNKLNALRFVAIMYTYCINASMLGIERIVQKLKKNTKNE